MNRSILSACLAILPALVCPASAASQKAVSRTRVPEKAAPGAVLAWFADAPIDGGRKAETSDSTLLESDGTFGRGVRLTRAVPLENPLLRSESGIISFWIKPDWNGDDGRTHHLLHIGDPEKNGLLVEKSDRNQLRFVMASAEKVSATRYDVSHWKAGEWHFVAVAWFQRDGQPYGLPLFLDENLPGRGGPEPVAGAVASGNRFLDPATMKDARVWIGDETSQASMDELIFRGEHRTNQSRDLREVIYRDYFLTAPYEALAVDPSPNHARSEPRVLAGFSKQFGLRGKLRGNWRPLMEFTERYGQWGMADARPFIQWETSNPAVATVDPNGTVKGIAAGHCRLTARFRGLEASFELEVISPDQPDLSVLYLERLPRLRCDAAKSVPAPGDLVQTVAHLGNYGFQTYPAGVQVRWELFPDVNGNFQLDAEDIKQQPLMAHTLPLPAALEPGEETQVTFDWKWVAQPVWVRVTVDAEGLVSESCNVNNQRAHLNIARPTRILMSRPQKEAILKERKQNLVGSFCYYDYAQAQFEALNQMLRDSVYPSTSPVGVEDSYWIDAVFEFENKRDAEHKAFSDATQWFDAFHVHLEDILMAQNSGALHEAGHNMFKLPDLYPYNPGEVFLRNGEGQLFTDTPLLPHMELLGPTPCGPYYDSFMDHCHLWLHPANAGKIHYYRGYRADERFWGAQGRLLPTRRNVFQFQDLDDAPLTNAAVYIYQVANMERIQYMPNRAKFIGRTDMDGQFVLPNKTERDWDDPTTDEVEGAIPVWNPFGKSPFLMDRTRDVPFTPNVVEAEGILLLKIVSGDQTEFRWLTDLDFQQAFYSGNHVEGRIRVNTSLRSSTTPTPVIRPEIPRVARHENKAPVALVKAPPRVRPGEVFTVSAADSNDPEGQPLEFYRWRLPKGVSVKESVPNWNLTQLKALNISAPKSMKELEIGLRVYDGLRWSQETKIRIAVKP